MDVSLLTSILSPCLGVLLAGADAAAEQIGASVGADVLALAKRLWGKLRHHVERKRAALEAAEDVARRPDDERARGALELQLEKILSELPALTGEIDSILKQAVAAGVVAAGERSVAVGGNVTGSVIVTGDSGVVQQ